MFDVQRLFFNGYLCRKKRIVQKHGCLSGKKIYKRLTFRLFFNKKKKNETYSRAVVIYSIAGRD
jgi:hypothetical protein